MKLEGGCYCGAVRYVAEGEPMMKAQCHCRECQYITGGSPNMFMLMPPAGFSYTKGTPKQFTRSDLESPVTREFCAECGTHLTTRRPGLPAVILKVGTLDDPSLFGTPQLAILTIDSQAFHQIPDGLPSFERLPNGRLDFVIARSICDEAIQSCLRPLDCFAEPVIGRAFARPVGSQ